MWSLKFELRLWGKDIDLLIFVDFIDEFFQCIFSDQIIDFKK